MTAALHPQQVTACGIGLIVCATNRLHFAFVAFALHGGALGQQLRQLAKRCERSEGVSKIFALLCDLQTKIRQDLYIYIDTYIYKM